MKISIVGWFGERNVGDEAFRTVFEKQFQGHDLKFVQKARMGHAAPDLIVFGGGGVVGGHYLRDVPEGVPKVAIGVDMSLNGHDYDRWRELNFDVTYLRSKEYTSLAQFSGRSVKYCPDITFSLDRPPRVPKVTGKLRLGVTLSEKLRGSEVDGHIVEALKKAQEEYTICLLPFYDGKYSDSGMHQEYLKGLTGVVDLGWSSTTDEHLKKLKGLDALITMRFHGTIFATLTGTPFVAISSKGKDSLFCEQENLHAYHLELNGLNPYRILDRLKRFKKDGHGVSRQLDAITAKNKLKVEEVFKSIHQRFLRKA